MPNVKKTPVFSAYEHHIRHLSIMCAINVLMFGSESRCDPPVNELMVSGKSQIESAYDITDKSRSFENWTDASISWRYIKFDIRYQMHQPPRNYSPDTTGMGIYQRAIGFSRNGFSFKAGNFYTILGNGITLHSYENRSIRWDTNIDGVYMDYAADKLEIKLLSGKPRDLSGVRYAPLQAGEIVYYPHHTFVAGITALVTSFPKKENVCWGSCHLKQKLPFGNIALEFALRDTSFTELGDYLTGRSTVASLNSKALFSSMNLFLGDLAVLLQYKDYTRFNLYEGVTYNNPPSLVKEHTFILPARTQHVVDADDERGFMIRAAHPLFDVNTIAVNYCQANRHDGILLYREFSGTIEAEVTRFLDGTITSGLQKTIESRNVNIGLIGTFIPFEKFSFTGSYEHQHSTVTLTKRKYYSRIFSLGVNRLPNLSVTMILEHTTDQLSIIDKATSNRFWFGTQVNWKFLDNYELVLFTGSRRAGKTCSGGFCMYTPEFKGGELNLTAGF